MEGNDPSQMRISDADRHRVAEVLREAAGEGRLDLDELEERLEATYAAKVYADLAPIVADLPGSQSVPAVRAQSTPVPRPSAELVAGAPHYSTSFALMSGQDRRGVWRVGPTHNAFAMWGAITIDLREAVFVQPEVVINANALWAAIDVIVNRWTGVRVEGVGIMGDFSQSRDKVPPDLRPDSPLVRVRGVALMAGISVVRKPMPGESRKRLRGHLGH
jgi:hypothetical protein